MSERTSELTDRELEGLAAQAFNMARRDLEQRRGFNCLLASYHAGESLHRMERLERLLAEKLGERWVGDASVKEAAFDLIRMATGMLPPDAIVIATVVNRFVPTEKFHEEAFEKRQELAATGPSGWRQGVEDGYFRMCTALHAVAQTPSRVCVYIQNDAEAREPGRPEVSFWAQDEFRGNLKMFGKEADYGEEQKTEQKTGGG